MRSIQLLIWSMVTALMLAVYTSAWAAFGEDTERPKPEFSQDGSDQVVKLIPRGKSTSIQIRFHVDGATLDNAFEKNFDEKSQPQADLKTFRSGFFGFSITTPEPGGEAAISLTSDYFTTATELWAPKEKGSSAWAKTDTLTAGPKEGEGQKTKSISLTVKDGGVMDADGTANGRIEFIFAPQDSFWGYALGTLVIRFFGVFMVLGILMIGMMLSGKVFESIGLKGKTAVPAPSQVPAPSPARQEPEVYVPEPVPVEEIPADVAAAIGLGIHLYTNGGRNLRLPDSGMKAAAAVGLALHLEKTSGTE